MIKELIEKNRSFRRFHQYEKVDESALRDLVDLARLAASAANLQPLKYIISSGADLNSRIFPTLAWAGYMKDWPGPEEGERPSAYIIALGDNEISKSICCDHGIACQNILLGAVECGLGGCLIGSIDRPKLREILSLPDRYEILLVVALGRPKETVVIDPVGSDGDIKYWRAADGIHHVPKRSLDEIIVSES